MEAIRLLVKELEVPLIGFAGAPFTLACYLVEGGPSRTFARTKAMLYGEPAAFDRLLEALVDIVRPHLRAQVDAGAQVVQVFDSWVGVLDPRRLRRSVLPHMRRLFEGLAGPGVPAIHFGVGTGQLLDLLRDAGGDAVGVDHRVPLDDAWDASGHDAGVQGNLDPAVLLGTVGRGRGRAIACWPRRRPRRARVQPRPRGASRHAPTRSSGSWTSCTRKRATGGSR